ncbi:L-rhamnose/proton symporter RhaT [Wocania arenilitoris]|uniref:L-rhamnose/proton symporter RhaT n=1 Tax=Wocania arenilitoris TaxID=2044858 RepID=UPI001F2AA9FF|nr:L-rhamnose/proton symporter RhaT [Wocania arenilitoris]
MAWAMLEWEILNLQAESSILAMLIFFCYIVGVLMKEWKNVTKQTYVILITGLIVLVCSFIIITYGSMHRIH